MTTSAAAPGPDPPVAPAPGPAIPPARRAAVDRARLQWIDRLIDPSRRNNLLFFRDLRMGSLDLTSAPGEALDELLRPGAVEGGGVALSSLVEGASLAQATAVVAHIQRRAQANFEERGLDTLFLAVALATWPAEDGGRPVRAPVLLVPIEAAPRGRSGAWSLARAGDVRVNDVLLHALSVQHGVHLEADALIGEAGDHQAEALDVEAVCGRLAEAARGLDGFAIERRRVLGNFSFQKMAIVGDLKDLVEPLARHDLIAGIAGDADARAGARGSREVVDPRGFDRQPPEREFLVLDADSSQHAAIARAVEGQNGVVSGPPGTGKSQTIANLIAELAARGRTVLFVAEKRAALDVVLARLERAGLGHLCLDLHGAEVSRRRVAEQLGRSLELVRDAVAPEATALHARLVERRDRLNAHSAGLHVPRPPGGLSLFEIYGRLLALPAPVAATTRMRGDALAALTPEVVDRALAAVEEAASLAGLVTGDDPSPWTRARLVPGAVPGLIDRVRALATTAWSAVERAVARLAEEAGVASPVTFGDARRLVRTIAGLDPLLARYAPGLLHEDLSALATDLSPAASPIARLWALVTSARFRRALRTVRAHVADGAAPVSSAQALADVRAGAPLAPAWRALAPAGALPRRCPSLAESGRLAADGLAQVDAVAEVVGGRDLEGPTLDAVGAWLGALAADTTTPLRLLRAQELVAALVAVGFEGLIEEIRTRRPPPATWPDLLRHAWLRSTVEAAQHREPALAAFDGRFHDALVEEFRALDRQRLEVAVARVRRAHAERVTDARNRHPAQSDLVSREAQKRMRHLPLRRLFAAAPDVLLALRPCWMASPLSVSQLLPGDQPFFDVVVFDEASQVLPEDAVTSLLRGKRAVIAGDGRQLPPTTFFAAGVPEDEVDREEAGLGGTAGFESVLDVMSAFLDPSWSLDWHYRSRDEALIAFSNHHVYADRLVTFPGPAASGALSWVDAEQWQPSGGEDADAPAGEAGTAGLEPDGPASARGTDSVAREVRCVVRLVIDHARTRPHESLGVIALGIVHADRLEMAIERERRRHPDLEPFFAGDRPEPFFVKNLERVQGDERDAIVLTIGYGKDATGRLPHRFGPLLMEGGERRLNVAITRARRRMTVVSSFSPGDVQADSPRQGVRLLRAYLEYAASGGRRLASAVPAAVTANAFEQGVAEALSQRGAHVVAQLGVSRSRIDLAVVHPRRPGRYVLAVECDGASYHAAPTARDRDRLRQQHLEALGWRFHRIWSTDWFLRRDVEIARAMAAIEAAVQAADEQDARPAPVTVVAEPAPAPEAAAPAPSPAPSRGPRPALPEGDSIDDFSRADLRRLARWVAADGRLRTDEEWLDELMAELGFRRRGTRIVAALKEAIASVRGQAGPGGP